MNTNIRWVIRADVFRFDQILTRFGPDTSAGLSGRVITAGGEIEGLVCDGLIVLVHGLLIVRTVTGDVDVIVVTVKLLLTAGHSRARLLGA